jgi:hypothetical protein
MIGLLRTCPPSNPADQTIAPQRLHSSRSLAHRRCKVAGSLDDVTGLGQVKHGRRGHERIGGVARRCQFLAALETAGFAAD